MTHLCWKCLRNSFHQKWDGNIFSQTETSRRRERAGQKNKPTEQRAALLPAITVHEDSDPIKTARAGDSERGGSGRPWPPPPARRKARYERSSVEIRTIFSRNPTFTHGGKIDGIPVDVVFIAWKCHRPQNSRARIVDFGGCVETARRVTRSRMRRLFAVGQNPSNWKASGMSHQLRAAFPTNTLGAVGWCVGEEVARFWVGELSARSSPLPQFQILWVFCFQIFNFFTRLFFFNKFDN